MVNVDTKRIDWVDIFKALSMLLIVMAHVCGRFNDCVYQFHVTAFFFISGYTSGSRGSMFETVIKRVLTLLVPYNFFNLSGVILIELLERAHVAWLLSSETYPPTLQLKVLEVLRLEGMNCEWFGATWFLKVMFWASCLFEAEVRLSGRKRNILMSMSVLLFLLSLAIDDSIWKLMLKAQYFMAVGWMLKNRLKEGPVLRTTGKAFIIALLWGICMHLGLCETINWPTFKFNGLWDMIIPFFGIGMLICISQILAVSGEVRKPLLYVGRNTMGLMCLHFLSFKAVYLMLIAVGRMSWDQLSLLLPPDIYYMPELLAVTFITVAVSLLLWYLMGRSRLLRLLTGRWRKEELAAFYDILIIRELHDIYDILKCTAISIIDEYRTDFMVRKGKRRNI